MNKYTRMNWENTPSKATPLTADNLNHMDEGIERATDGAIALETEIATARGDSADLNTRFTANETSLEAVKSEIATARGSYGNLDQRLNNLVPDEEGFINTFNLADGAVTTAIIEDGAVTQNKLSADLKSAVNSIANKADTADVNAALALKANKATTLDGYGITDTYTQSEIKVKLDQKLKKMPFDDEPKQGSPCYLTSGAVYNALLAKADKSTTLAGYGISDAYTQEETNKKLARKLDSMPFDSEPKNNSPCYLTSGAVYNALLAKADKASTLAGYGITDAYTKNAVDTSLANKANLVNSSNIFDFDAWAKGLQGLTNPVYKGTLEKVDYNEKSFALTATESMAYTNGWTSSAPQSMRIAVKPKTKYLFSWLPSSTNCKAFVFLNGTNTTATRFELKKGFGSFTTAEDTTYILIRFDYNGTGFFKVSEIMITEKESIYLPNKVAEGVPEVANEVLTFEKTTQTSLDGKYDSSNVEVGKGELTPAQATYDGCEGSFNYSKIGKTVTVALNITTLVAGKNYVQFAGLPFTAMTASKLSSIVAYTTANKLVNIRLHGSWLYISSPGTTFAEGEKISAIITYIIN